MEIVRIIGVALTAVILISLLKNSKAEFSVYIGIAASILILLMVLPRFQYIFEFLSAIYNDITYGKDFLPIIFKVLAIAYLADFAASLCRDAGETAIAGKVELAGKIIIFYVALPIFLSVVELINSLL